MNKSHSSLPVTGERLVTNYKNKTAVEHLHRYTIAQEYIANKVVLDIASGEGYGSNLLSNTAKFVYGVDISKEAVSHANNKYAKDNLTFLEGSAAKIPLEDHSVDVLVSFETIEHHDKHEEMMQECRRVLKKEGILIISSPDKKYFSDIPKYHNEFHVKELYKEEFFRLVSSYFSNVQLYKQGITMGSIVYPEKNVENGSPVIYTGDYDLCKRMNDIKNPVYNVIIAGNSTFEAHSSSYFESEFVNADLIEELETYKRLYKQTMLSPSYRVGHFVMLPFRAVRKIYRMLLGK